jgi:paired amphipathic helix protein Sin3a
MHAQDELSFFDRAKKALESRETYDEFLKLLNMFSREVIDARSLISRAQAFLGDSELYEQFKDLMGWDQKVGEGEEGPPGSMRVWTALSNETEERFGKSYRRLPLAVCTVMSGYTQTTMLTFCIF